MATDLSSYLIRSFSHYKRKARTTTALVQRGIQQLMFQPDQFADLQTALPTNVSSRFLKGYAENISLSQDPSQEFSLEVKKEGSTVTQLVSVSKNSETAYQIKFVGTVDAAGLVTLSERFPPKSGEQVAYGHYEIQDIVYENDLPDWYKVSSVESLCVLEAHPDGKNPTLAILHSHFGQISFCSKVDRVIEIADKQLVMEEIVPLLFICKGLLSFIENETVLSREDTIPERPTIQGLFLWKSVELLISKLEQIYSLVDPKNPSSQAAIDSLVEAMRSLVIGTKGNYYERFLQPFEESIARFITTSVIEDPVKAETYREAQQVLLSIKQGFDILKSGFADEVNLADLRKLVTEAKAFFPKSDACLDGLLKLWLSSSHSHQDEALWAFVSQQYLSVLKLNDKSQKLSAYPLTRLLDRTIFSRSEGLCSIVVSTVNSAERHRHDITIDVHPKTSSPEINRQFLKLLDKAAESPGGFYSPSSLLSVYGDWAIKWTSQTAVAINSVTLQRVELVAEAELSLMYDGRHIFYLGFKIIGQKITQDEQGQYISQIVWFDFARLDELKDSKVTELKFAEHLGQLPGTSSNFMPGTDGYLLGSYNQADGTIMQRVKLGEVSEPISGLERKLLDRTMLYYYKGCHIVAINENLEGNRYLAQSNGQLKKMQLALLRITDELETEEVDSKDVELFADMRLVEGDHTLPTTSNSGHFYSRFQFFSRDSTVYMLLLNVALTTKFTLWRLKRDTKFEFVTHFDGVSRQLSRYQRKHQLGIMDVTGWVNHTSRRNPLCLLMLLIDSEDLKQPQRGAVCRSTHGGVRIRSVKIDLRHF